MLRPGIAIFIKTVFFSIDRAVVHSYNIQCDKMAFCHDFDYNRNIMAGFSLRR